MLSTLRMAIAEGGKSASIEDTKLCPFPLMLDTPEFHGKSEDGPFTISQVLAWEPSSNPQEIKFHLVGDPRQTGMELKGRLGIHGDEVHIKSQIRNVSKKAIQSGHHSFILNTDAATEFHDPTGERTFLYAETGWASLAQLLNPVHSHKYTIRMGATYNQITVMWKLMARVDPKGKKILAVGLDKGYAFAGDHPDWPKGILGGYRWGTIGPQESKTMRGKIYLIKGTLNDLRLRYVNDFK